MYSNSRLQLKDCWMSEITPILMFEFYLERNHYRKRNVMPEQQSFKAIATSTINLPEALDRYRR